MFPTQLMQTENVAPIIKEINEEVNKKKTLNPLIFVRNAEDNLPTLLTIFTNFDGLILMTLSHLSSCHELNKSFYFKWFYDFIVAFQIDAKLKVSFCLDFPTKNRLLLKPIRVYFVWKVKWMDSGTPRKAYSLKVLCQFVFLPFLMIHLNCF